jgi:hypothetical protein
MHTRGNTCKFREITERYLSHQGANIYIGLQFFPPKFLLAHWFRGQKKYQDNPPRPALTLPSPGSPLSRTPGPRDHICRGSTTSPLPPNFVASSRSPQAPLPRPDLPGWYRLPSAASRLSTHRLPSTTSQLSHPPPAASPLRRRPPIQSKPHQSWPARPGAPSLVLSARPGAQLTSNQEYGGRS